MTSPSLFRLCSFARVHVRLFLQSDNDAHERKQKTQQSEVIEAHDSFRQGKRLFESKLSHNIVAPVPMQC